MLTGTKEGARAPKSSSGALAKAMRPEWLGQTTASVCWIASVFTYGISSAVTGFSHSPRPRG